MNELPAALLPMLSDHAWLWLVVLLRIGPVFALLPGFSETSVPQRLKFGAAAAATVIVATALTGVDLPAPSIPAFVALLLSETVIGLGLGFGVRLFLMGLQTAGTMIAQSTSLSQALGNTGMDPMPAMGHLLVLGGICLAMILGLHVETVRYLLVSYEMFPIGAVPVAAEMAEWGLSGVASAFRLAFVLAAPFMIVSLLYNLTLGVINRAMPQLMVVFVGAPLITFGGLALLFLLAPRIVSIWAEALFRFLGAPF